MASIVADLTSDDRWVPGRACPLWASVDEVATFAAQSATDLITKRPVNGRQFAQLPSFVLVVVFVDGLKQLLNHGYTQRQVGLVLRSDKHVQIFVVGRVRFVPATFLLRATPTNLNLAIRLLLHALLCQSTRS